MFSRRQFLTRSLQASSLFAVGSVVPQFIVNTARAAEVGKDTVLVIVEMTGGNDGLNTVIPYTDDLYHKARPTLRFKKDQVVKVDDHIGLHPSMRSFETLLKQNALAIVQGVGYPNPDRSHFESMDIWQSGDPKRALANGWIGRSSAELAGQSGNIPAMHVGPNKLPLALQGGSGGVVSINNQFAYKLDLGNSAPAQQKAHRSLMEDLANDSRTGPDSDLLQFVQRRELQTYSTLDRLQEVLKSAGQLGMEYGGASLYQKMSLIARLIDKGFGTRVFYVAIDGFDTHSGQAEMHQRLLGELAGAITQLFGDLKGSGNDKRTVVMTFSEFGRRVNENGSRGTDHGSGSCLFVAGPAVKGGLVGKHPILSDLDAGDLRYHTDFRRVYATLLDGWLGVDSKLVLGSQFEKLPLLRGKV